MKIVIEIDTDNAAWQDSPTEQCHDVSQQINTKLALYFTNKGNPFPVIRDLNGNATGTIEVVEG